MTGNQGFRVDPRGVVPHQSSGTFDFHLGNNATNLSRNSLFLKSLVILAKHNSRPAGAFDTVYRFAWRARSRKYKRTLRSLLLLPLLENVASQPTQRQRLRIGLCGPRPDRACTHTYCALSTFQPRKSSSRLPTADYSPLTVGSENSDPFHSGNSEPSGNSRKG